ncbi:unnamed protein product [Ascophyllum nodosum]
MADVKDDPVPQWLVQEPEGAGSPRTPGRWKSLWPGDCTRLEEAHEKGDAEVLVFGRKYVVDMKERTVRALYLKEKPEKRPVRRATYFVRQGNGWLPYSEKDAESLEKFYGSAKKELEEGKMMEPEFTLDNGENKVVMKKQVRPSGSLGQENEAFDVALQQKSVKAPSVLATTFIKTAFEVCRGNPDPGKWGGVFTSSGEEPRQSKPPKHLVFVVHGIGESLWARPTSTLGNLRVSCASLCKMAGLFLDEQKKTSKEKEQPSETKRNDLERTAKGMETQDTSGVSTNEGGQEVDAGFVEFLPVEWYEQVHGEGVLEDGLIQDITLDAIPAFRDFANQAMMDVMMYLTPELQAKIINTVATEFNRMWDTFCKYNPKFTGKVSVLAHSLGGIITHDVFMGQPKRGETAATKQGERAATEGLEGSEIPIIKFDPDVLLTCGSPIGTFLCLRASRLDRKNLFKFNTVKRFFNLFHLHDPVAYRLEPLIDRRLRDFPPEHVPHKGGDRINVVVKRFNRDMFAAIDNLHRSTTDGLFRVQNTLTSTMKSVIGNTGPDPEESETPIEEVRDARDALPERIDWAIQESPIEGMHPWASAIFAHSSYFQNIDMVMFLINAMEEGRSIKETRDKIG